MNLFLLAALSVAGYYLFFIGSTWYFNRINMPETIRFPLHILGGIAYLIVIIIKLGDRV